MWIRGYPGIFNIKPSNPKIHGLLFCFCTFCFMLNQTILRSILFLIFLSICWYAEESDVTPKNNNWHSTQVTQTHTYHIMVQEDSLYSYYLMYVVFMFRSWRCRWYIWKYTVIKSNTAIFWIRNNITIYILKKNNNIMYWSNSVWTT